MQPDLRRWNGFCNFAKRKLQEDKTMATLALNETQLQLVKMFSFAKTKEATEKLKKVLVAYYAKEIDKEMDALWKAGKMTAAKNEKIAHTHLRTPYKK